ncbi:hypothetical protein [Citricoccus sp. NR2]|uniref:hypothetical protein n=1 Tax=Citricoccus sp. NR2 TaxID=3004095 RepID=UPI0022DD3170|nr:hypothetical protein [Citricoccus sp. NR2]WBL19097.1 hypothetical protein O1A05_15380 [Citricoccus sp. NR2]
MLLEAFGWQATFLVAVPIMALVAIGAPLLVPENKDPPRGSTCSAPSSWSAGCWRSSTASSASPSRRPSALGSAC